MWKRVNWLLDPLNHSVELLGGPRPTTEGFQDSDCNSCVGQSLGTPLASINLRRAQAGLRFFLMVRAIICRAPLPPKPALIAGQSSIVFATRCERLGSFR